MENPFNISCQWFVKILFVKHVENKEQSLNSLSRTFSFTVPGRWNDLPTPSGMLDPCQFSSNNWKLISFNSTWLHKKKKKIFTFSKSSSFSLSFSPSLASLYLFEQCHLHLRVIGTSSLCLPLQDYRFYVLPNCKSLWIKASAKWLNVNVNYIFHFSHKYF